MKRTRGFRFAYHTATGAQEIEVYQDASGEWHQAPTDCAIDIDTGYRIGRWLGPARWNEADARAYLGL